MSPAAADVADYGHGRHRSLHRGRATTIFHGTSSVPLAAPMAVADPDLDDRTIRQRISDALPMTSVAGICFALGLSLRASGTGGPAPALPIWTLFLALGCIASLGAGASWVVGGGGTARSGQPAEFSPPAARREPARSARPRHDAAVLPRSAHPESLGDPTDDTLPALNWDAQIPIMAKKRTHRMAEAAPTDDPMPDFPGDGTPEATNPRQVIEEIDRLVSDLKPSTPRPRPTG